MKVIVWIVMLVASGAATPTIIDLLNEPPTAAIASETVRSTLGDLSDARELSRSDLCPSVARIPAGALKIHVAGFDGGSLSEETTAAVQDALEWLPQDVRMVQKHQANIQIRLIDERFSLAGKDMAGYACGHVITVASPSVQGNGFAFALMHEFGHVFGLDHEEGTFMQESISGAPAMSLWNWSPTQRALLA